MLAFYTIIVLINLLALRAHKKSIWLDIINILFIIVFVGGNSDNPDYEGYMIRFDSDVDGTFELGYLVLTTLCRELGLKYQDVVTVFCVLSVFIVYLSARLIKSNFSYYSILYLMTLCFIDAVQFRQMICYSIFTLTIYFLAKERRVLSTVLLIIGSLFQTTTLFFIPFALFSKFFSRKDVIKKMWYISLGLCILTFLNGNTIPYLESFLEGNLADSKLVYFQTKARFGFVIYYAYLIACSYCAYTLSKAFSNLNNVIGKYSTIIYSAYAYSSFSIPLIMMNNTFFRFLNFPLLGLFLVFSCFLWISFSRKAPDLDLTQLRYFRKKIVIGICLTVLSYNIFLQMGNVVSDVFKYNAYYTKYVE